jgi:hypothetical protein
MIIFPVWVPIGLLGCGLLSACYLVFSGLCKRDGERLAQTCCEDEDSSPDVDEQ